MNFGSVGQPRDRDPTVSYALVDIEDGEISVSHRRAGYNINFTASKMSCYDCP